MVVYLDPCAYDRVVDVHPLRRLAHTFDKCRDVYATLQEDFIRTCSAEPCRPESRLAYLVPDLGGVYANRSLAPKESSLMLDVERLIFTAEVLKGALMVLGPNGEHWTQKAHGRLVDGQEVPLQFILANEVVAFSIVGAINRACFCNQPTVSKACRFIERAIAEHTKTKNFVSALDFNDVCVDFAVIKAVMQRAAELATN